jgi:hypothetical protein
MTDASRGVLQFSHINWWCWRRDASQNCHGYVSGYCHPLGGGEEIKAGREAHAPARADGPAGTLHRRLDHPTFSAGLTRPTLPPIIAASAMLEAESV